MRFNFERKKTEKKYWQNFYCLRGNNFHTFSFSNKKYALLISLQLFKYLGLSIYTFY